MLSLSIMFCLSLGRIEVLVKERVERAWRVVKGWRVDCRHLRRAAILVCWLWLSGKTGSVLEVLGDGALC